MDSPQDLPYVDHIISQSQLGQLRCVNRKCQHGNGLKDALKLICSFYNVDYKWGKEVCSHCYDQCLLHYEQLERKQLSGKRLLKSEFSGFASYQYIESLSSSASSSLLSSDYDKEPRPSTSTSVPRSDKPKSVVKSSVGALVGECFYENKSILNNHISMCDEYMREVKKSCYIGMINIDKLSRDLKGLVSELRKEIICKPFDSTLEFLPNVDLIEPSLKKVKYDIIFKQNKESELDIGKNKDEEVNCESSYTVKVYPSYDVPLKIGPQNYLSLNDGDLVFALKSNLLQPWCKGTIKSKLYKDYMHVKFGSEEKLLTTKEVAYPTQNSIQFRVGARVIAKSNNTPVTSNPELFFAGVIGEPPTLINQFRYLIFFDSGFVEYRYHKDIRLIVHKSSDVWNDVYHKSKEFIQSYLELYPERQMVKLIKHHTVRIEHENRWQTAKVVEIDASIVQLYFPYIKKYEWIYRGSSRLWKISERDIHLRQSGLAYSSKPFIEYTSTEEPELRNRNVARKSTSKFTSSLNISIPSKCANDDLCETLTLKLPKFLPRPKMFIAHDCDYSCVEWTAYDYNKTKQISMLAIPLYYGFRRALTFFNSSQKCVMYKTPCGRLIKNTKEMFDYLNMTKNKMTIDLFDFNSWVKPLSEFRVLKPKKFLNDISSGKEFKGITCVNLINHKLPPPMVYMTSRKPMPGVDINVESDFLCGCDCTDNCQDKSKCACWQLTIEGQNILPNLYKDPIYIGYDNKRLPERVLTGIYECNKNCKCSSSCLNRVVQCPLSQKLQLFLTEKKGWGVRCLNDVPQGSFLFIFVGYLFTESDANERGINYGDEYLADLDYIEVIEKIKEDYESDIPSSDQENSGTDESLEISESADINYQSTSEVKKTTSDISLRLRKRKKPNNGIKTKKDDRRNVSKLNTYYMKIDPNPSKSLREYYGDNESVYIMDAKTSGNIGRYMNHSCSPNTFVQNVFVDTHDLRFPWISFFALHYIPAGTELTWDYNYTVGSVPGKTVKCHCESVNCRGRLL